MGPYDQLASGVKGSKVFKFQEETKTKKKKKKKKKKKIQNLVKLLESDWRTRLAGLAFWFYLKLSIPKKLKNVISEMPIIPQILNIDSLRIICTKSFDLQTAKMFIKYALKKVM